MKNNSLTNRKGGVGKTTVAVNLAAALATNFKLNCVLIDADPIGSSSLWMEETSIQRLKLKKLTLPNSLTINFMPCRLEMLPYQV